MGQETGVSHGCTLRCDLGQFPKPRGSSSKKIGDWILIKMSLTQRFNDLVDRNKESQGPEINQKINRFILEI